MGEWHASVCKVASKKTPWWWILPSSRIILFYPPVFEPLLFTLGILKLCENLPSNDLFLIGCPKEYSYYIRESKPAFNVIVEQKKISISSKIKEKLAAFKKIILFIIRFALLFLKSLKYSLHKPLKKITAKTLVFSYYFGIQNLEKIGDHFFKDMLYDLPGFKKNDIFYLYFNSSNESQSEQKIKKWMDEKALSFATIESLLRLTDCFRILARYLLIIYQLRKVRDLIPAVTINGLKSYYFSIYYHQTMIMDPPLFSELSVYYATRRLFGHLTASSILYPYESKGIERALLKANHDNDSHCKTIAYAHAIYNQGISYVRHHHDELVGSLKPDLIVCTGERMKNWFSCWGKVDPEKLIVIGSSRYLPPLPHNENSTFRAQALKVLFLGGLEHELEKLALLIEEDPSLFEHCHLMIRSYPHAYKNKQKKQINYIQSLNQNIIEDCRPLMEQIKDCDVVMMSSTSAGVEAMLSGRPLIYIDLHGFIDLDPFANKGDLSPLIRCIQGSELKEALKKIRNMNQFEYATFVKNQIYLAEEIFSPPDKTKIAQTLN